MGQWGTVMPQLPLAFFEKKILKKNAAWVSHSLPLAFFEKKNNKNNVCHYLSQYRASYSIFFFSFDLSHTCLFPLVVSHSATLFTLISPLQLSLFRLLLLSSLSVSHSCLSDSEVRTQSSATFISLPNPNPAEQKLLFPSPSQNLRLSPNHFSFLFCSQPNSHIMFLPNLNPVEQLVVFPSLSQIFRLL